MEKESGVLGDLIPQKYNAAKKSAKSRNGTWELEKIKFNVQNVYLDRKSSFFFIAFCKAAIVNEYYKIQNNDWIHMMSSGEKNCIRLTVNQLTELRIAFGL